jgi:hypothetical protein
MSTKKQIIRLTEGDLHSLIKESVKSILSELDTNTLKYARDKAMEKMRTAPSEVQREYHEKQYDNFNRGLKRRENELYDGVNSNNYQYPGDYPDKIITKANGEKVYKTSPDYYRGGTTDAKNVRNVNPNAQRRGAMKIDKFNRALDHTASTVDDRYKGMWDDETKSWKNA